MNEMLEKKIGEIDNLQRKDHDTLILVHAKVDNLLEIMTTLKEGYEKRLIKVEERIKYFSDLEIALDPKDMKSKVTKLWDLRDKFSFTWKLVVGISSVIGGVIGFVLSTISDASKFLR